jgi:hypothetical protein
VNTEPFDGRLVSGSRRAAGRDSSRLIARPRPGAAVLALVGTVRPAGTPSKMICCLSTGMPMPVSATENAMTSCARFRSSFSELHPAVAGWIVSDTSPWCVNLNAFDSRFLMICCSRFASVNSDFGSRGSRWIEKWHRLRLGDVAERPLDVALQLLERELADIDRRRFPTRSSTGSRMSLISIRRSLPDE